GARGPPALPPGHRAGAPRPRHRRHLLARPRAAPRDARTTPPGGAAHPRAASPPSHPGVDPRGSRGGSDRPPGRPLRRPGRPHRTRPRPGALTVPKWLEELTPILLLLVVIAIVINRLPRVDLGHSDRYRHRRARNWLPVGLLYSFLYMGRYNLTVAKGVFEDMAGPSGDPLMTNADFGWIF